MIINPVIFRQNELVKELSFFDNWEDKYEYIISLAKKLTIFPQEKKIDKYLIKGCQSYVWFDSYIDKEKLYFIATSDSLIVSGLIAMLLKVYNNVFPIEILKSNTEFIKEIGFSHNLTINRENGLKSILYHIYTRAKKYSIKNENINF